MISNTEKVRSAWWDGPDFLVENEDGTVTRYENAHFSSHTVSYLPGSGVEVEVLDLSLE